MTKNLILVFVWLAFSGVSLHAETNVLNSGKTVEGKAMGINKGSIVMADPNPNFNKSICSPLLQKDILNNIRLSEGVEPVVISQIVVYINSLGGGKVSEFAEKWIVSLDGKNKEYGIKVVPTPDGGSDFFIEPFDSFIQKVRKGV
ncbi:MAG: hypothetical protein NT088_04525 [Candidatus Omnitrophica bacterium]|nr:hypothetical protein [Candidatus Omnitrophota bacterium]